MKSTKGNN